MCVTASHLGGIADESFCSATASVESAAVTVAASMKFIAPASMIAMVEMPRRAAVESSIMSPAFECVVFEVVVVEVVPVKMTVIKIPAVEEVRVTASIESVVPRARSNKHAVRKPLRPVVAIGRASVGVIRVVTPRANRRRPNGHHCWSNSNPNSYSHLRIRGACREDQCSQQRKVF